MVSFPPCKINLGLHIVSKRGDGFHDLETIFYPVPWADVLEIIPSDSFSFESSGRAIPGREEDNICVKGYQLIRKDFSIAPVKIHLHKLIPMGAGLGGGSSDGAHALILVNQIFGLNLSTQQLRDYAVHLGSDCAFFLENQPMLGTGRGEVLNKISVSLKGKFILIVKPEIHVSTADAYASVSPKIPLRSLSDLNNYQIEEWKDIVINDFENTVFARYPDIGKLKDKMYGLGAVYASMSGSGSSVFGIFDAPIETPDPFKTMVHWSGKLN
jgi:4-diphosphocytidyl-2-C-methyl-D-erythritol kinase